MTVSQLFANAKANTILAPMAGYTDFAFRKICSDYGATLTVTEMVSSKALVMNNQLSRQLLHRAPNDGNSFCQIFGHEPEVMAQSVAIDEVQAFEGVDINMGCPVRKIVSNGDGSALMENRQLAGKCISAVKLALGNKPLSVKFRLGVTDDSLAVDFAKMCKDSGADFITVHFRTRKQMYEGNADFTLLGEIAKCGLPVFANGDVCTSQQYNRLIEQGAFGVAVGRGAVGRPYVFSQIAGEPYQMDVVQIVRQHANQLLQFFDERVVVNEMKKHAVGYVKGMRNARVATMEITSSKSLQQILDVVTQFVQQNSKN